METPNIIAESHGRSGLTKHVVQCMQGSCAKT